MSRVGGSHRAHGHRCLLPDELHKEIPKWNLSNTVWTYPQQRMISALETHDFVIYSGGNFGGKTFPAVGVGVGAALGFFDCFHCKAHPEARLTCPHCKGHSWCPVPADIMLVGLRKSQARDAMQKYLKFFMPRSQMHHSTYREGLWETVELCNGSVTAVYTVGQGAETHQGGRRSLIVYDEEPTAEVVEEGLFRFREDMDAKILITMTPTKGQSWVYDELILKAEEKEIALIQASVFENGTPPCKTCGHDRDWWTAELRKLGVRRQTEEADAACWRCRTYGVEPRISATKVRKAEARVTDKKRLAMRFHGMWNELRGDRAFDPLEIHAMQRACRAPDRIEAGLATWADADPTHAYVIGCDAALGAELDETVICVLDAFSGEQVVVWGDNETEPPVYIHEIVALAEEYQTSNRKAKVWVENISAGLYLIPELDKLGIPIYRHRSPDKKRKKIMYNQMGFIPSPRNRDRLLHELIAALKRTLIWKCDCHDDEKCPEFAPKTKVVVEGRKNGLLVRDRATVAQLEKLFYNYEKNNRTEVTSGHDDRIFALAGAHECRQKVGKMGTKKPVQVLSAEEQYWASLKRVTARGGIDVHPFAMGR